MTITTQINLGTLAGNGEVRNISGRDRGLSARVDFGLDQLDAEESSEVEIYVPEYMDTITPSFFQGLFESSMRQFGMDRQEFDRRYRLNASDVIQRAYERGMRAILTRRDFTQSVN
jgi:hypothetical protein